MIGYFRKIISLNNLKKSNLSGQVATLLMLIMVGVLIFILVTVNLGQISLTATNLSNAADSASLHLASQLSTKANMLYNTLKKTKGCKFKENPPRCCKKVGFGGIFGAIIGAVLAITGALLLQPGLVNSGWLIAVGAGGGAVGGGVGGAYAGTGFWQGAIKGAMIGTAIAGGVNLSTSAVTKAAIAAGEKAAAKAAAAAAEAGWEDGWAIAWAMAEAFDAAYSSVMAYTTPAVVGSVALSSGAFVFSAYVDDKMTSDAFAATAKALNGLPEYDRYREGMFFQALSQTIDDPNKIQDVFDSDGDGDTQERVPYFQYWWDRRVEQLKQNTGDPLSALTQSFINRLPDSSEIASLLQPLSRTETDGSDGAVIEVARALENAGYDISFYKPGTPPPDDPDCDTCGPEDYYDEVDAVVSEFNRFGEIVQELKGQDIDQLTSTWQSWIGLFYDTERTGDYYDILGVMVDGDETFSGLRAWKSELENKRRQLPDCIYCDDDDTTPNPPCVDSINIITNPPCKDGSFGSIDSDLDDEFILAQAKISDLIAEAEDLRTDFKNYYHDMQAVDASKSTDYGGINPVTYEWTDSRGKHSITVEVGDFKVPRIKVKKKGGFLKRKICLVLKDYSDDGSRCWVKITRQDPTNKEIKSGSVALGLWNPSPFSGEISRISRASYSYNYVSISDRD